MGRIRTPHRCLTAPSKPLAHDASLCNNAGTTLKASFVETTFRLYGISPVIGVNAQRSLAKKHHEANCELRPSMSLIPVSTLNQLGLTMPSCNSPRFASSWGALVSGDAVCDPSLLSFEAFQCRRIPLSPAGSIQGTGSGVLFNCLKQLMTDAPSEFPSLYWGHKAEFAASGVHVLSGAHPATCVDAKGVHFELYNAGQTTNPQFFTPSRCVAYVPFLVPEMKHSYTALSFFWDTMHRQNRTKVYDEWFSMSFIESCGLRLNGNARVVNGRCNMWDFESVADAMRAKNNVRRMLRKSSCDDSNPSE